MRETLRGLDPAMVKAAVERSLVDGNESARVAAVKLLADLEPFRGDGCPVCREREVNGPQLEARLLELLTQH